MVACPCGDRGLTKKKSPKERERALKGTGSRWQRADGRYSAAIVVPRRDPVTGRIARKKESTTRKTEEEVDLWLARKRHEIAEAGGALSEANAHKEATLHEHLEAWLRDSVEPRVAPNTLQKRIWAASNHIAPALGHLSLSEVSPREVQALYAQLSREGYSAATRREVHVTLRQALGQAVRWGLLSRNPASPEFVDAPKQSKQHRRSEAEEEEVRALSDQQAQELFAYAEGRGSRWRHYYVVAVRTGLRPGEALGLRWGDLDLRADPASLRVRRTLDTHHAPRFGPPKSDASRRTLALHHEAKEALVLQQEMLAGEGLLREPHDLVFPSQVGTPMNSGNLRKKHLQRDLAGASLPKLTLHELRHTFASIMLHEWHVPPAVVQKMMGHDSIRMTMDLYGHLVPGAEADIIRRLNSLQQGSVGPVGGQTEQSGGWEL